jgi:hypothetical protein
MFILRRITSESIEINDCLGTSYVMILKERNIVEFERTANAIKWDDADTIKDVYGFISYNNGADVMPLYKKSHYYVMASDGRTFANISEKA